MSVLNINEAVKQEYISEIWEVPTIWEFKEPTDKDKSVVDGKAIIGIIEGQFFVPDGKSRNERFYPKVLWESVLKSKPVREKLDNLLMFGMIGHEDKAVTEEDLRRGDVSHIISDLWIDEKERGMGKAYILNTDAGKNLYIYLKAGAKLKTSSRARGKFVESEKKEGLPIVDTDSFYLETFDFVINPGFEETSATLMEKLMREKIKRGDAVVDEYNISETVKYLTESSEKLQSQLKASLTEIANLKIEKDTLVNENKSLVNKVTSLSFLENVDKSVIEALSEFDENDWNSILNSKIKVTGGLRETSYVHNSVSYDAVFIPVKTSKIPLNKFESVVKSTMNEWDKNNVPVDTVFVKKKDNNVFNSNGLLILWKEGQRPMNATESVMKLVIEENHDLFEGYGVPLTKAFTREQEEMFNRDLNELSAYRSLGSVNEVNKAIDASTSLIKEYQELGTPSEINILLDKLSEEVSGYRELGSIDEISEGLDKLSNTIKEYQELGSVDEINKLISVVEEYQELGSVNEVKTLIDVAKEYSEIGSPKQVNECLDMLVDEINSYRELGTVSEVESLLSVVENYATGDSKDLMEKYMRIGTPEDIVSTIEEAKEIVSDYLEIGSIDEINESLDRLEVFLTKYSELGSLENVTEALEKSQAIIDSYIELGTPEEINEALDVIVEFSNEVGKPSEIIESFERANELLEQYKLLGTPEEINEALNIAINIVDNNVNESVKPAEKSAETSTRAFKSFNENVEPFISESVKSVKNNSENVTVRNIFKKTEDISNNYKNNSKTMTESDKTSLKESKNKEKSNKYNETSRLVSIFKNYNVN